MRPLFVELYMKIGYEFAMHLLGAIYSTNHIFCYSRDSIPSLATMVHFSALAFLAPTNPRNPRNPPKLKLFKLIMEDPNQRRSNRSRKPTVPYDERIAQSLDLSTHCSVSKPSKKPTAKPTESAKSIPLTLAPVLIDAIDELCDGIEELDLKAKKKAKADEIGRLSKLGLKKVMEEAKIQRTFTLTLLILVILESLNLIFHPILMLVILWNCWTYLSPLKSIPLLQRIPICMLLPIMYLQLEVL
jgi:hypothetical protein